MKSPTKARIRQLKELYQEELSQHRQLGELTNWDHLIEDEKLTDDEWEWCRDHFVPMVDVRIRVRTPGERFLVVLPSIVGNPEDGYSTAYSSDWMEFGDRGQAIRNGFEVADSDDFLVVTLSDAGLLAVGWMWKDRHDPEALAGISREFDIPIAETD